MGFLEDLEAKNTPQDRYLPPKKRKIFQEPGSQPNPVEEETGKTTIATSGGNRSHGNRPAEDLEAKNGLEDPERKTIQEPGSQPNLVEEETGKTTAATSSGSRSHGNRPAEDLEAKNGLEDPEPPAKKRRIFQEPRSIKPIQVEEETGKTIAAMTGGNRSHGNRPIEDHEAKNGLEDPAQPAEKRRSFQEPRSIKPNQVGEETRNTTTGTSGGNRGHRSRTPCEKLCTGVQPCEWLMQTLLGLGIINRPVRVLGKKLSQTDVNPDQNRLQHSEKEVKQVLLEMMTEGEKQLATRQAVGDGLRVSVLDRLGRVYHMKLKKLYNGKKCFRFRGPDYHKFLKDNHLTAGDILETWAVRVQRRAGFQIREEGDGGIMEGELLLVMLNYEDDSYKESCSEETGMSPPAENEALHALLLLHKKPVIFKETCDF